MSNPLKVMFSLVYDKKNQKQTQEKRMLALFSQSCASNKAELGKINPLLLSLKKVFFFHPNYIQLIYL